MISQVATADGSDRKLRTAGAPPILHSVDGTRHLSVHRSSDFRETVARRLGRCDNRPRMPGRVGVQGILLMYVLPPDPLLQPLGRPGTGVVAKRQGGQVAIVPRRASRVGPEDGKDHENRAGATERRSYNNEIRPPAYAGRPCTKSRSILISSYLSENFSAASRQRLPQTYPQISCQLLFTFGSLSRD